MGDYVTLNATILSISEIKVEDSKLQEADIRIKIDHNPTISTEDNTLYGGGMAFDGKKFFPIYLFSAENFHNYAVIKARVERQEQKFEEDFDFFLSLLDVFPARNWGIYKDFEWKFKVKISKDTTDKQIKKDIKEAIEKINEYIVALKSQRSFFDKGKNYNLYTEVHIETAIQGAIKHRNWLIGHYNSNKEIGKVRPGAEVWVSIPMDIIVKY